MISRNTRVLFVLITLLVSVGCSSSLAIRTAYNSSINEFERKMSSYADFNNSQQSAIKDRVASFKQWHKEVQLPVYIATINEVAAALGETEPPSKITVQRWVETLRGMSKQLALCSPLNNSGVFLTGLTNKQATQIAANIDKKQRERVQKYQSESPQQRLTHRAEEAAKWARRAGIAMTAEQSEVLKSTLEKQISLSPQRHFLWQKWTDQFNQLLEQRSQSQFSTHVDQHIHSLWNLTERHYPEQWTANIGYWTDFLHQLLQSLTDSQSEKTISLLKRVSRAFTTLYAQKRKADPQCFAVHSNKRQAH